MNAPHRSHRHALASAMLLVGSAPVVLGAGPKADFNGDGFEDLVCGAPLHDNRAPGLFLHRGHGHVDERRESATVRIYCVR